MILSFQRLVAADKFGPDPYQGDGKGEVSEDCLYLNVWAPAQSPRLGRPG